MLDTTAQETSRQVTEAARETSWRSAGFLRDLFLGKLRFDLVHPYPERNARAAFEAFYAALESFLRAEVDPVEIDASGEYPKKVLDGLAELGAFGMIIPSEYGGLGFSHREYERAMMLVGSYDANVAALLSAHQSIGVPQPLVLFGTEAQKREYLPRCACGAISAFALTEPAVGSDPAHIGSTATPTEDGEAFVLNGTKLWCTNGTLAELIVVMARTPKGITAFVVETGWRGVEVAHRCRFMGLSALANAELAFDNVRVPRANVIGQEGRGLKVALTTLNAGRLSLPATAVGAAKLALEASRKWASVRVQWGQPIGAHEAISHMLADMAATTFAMEAVADVATAMADHPEYDIRLEAAAAKEWNTVRQWAITDEALEIRGGRGFESERSLAERGEFPIGIERMMRDSRASRIFEGSTEIMHLFLAREALDEHLQVAGALVDPHATGREKRRALLRAIGFYATWYPRTWLGWSRWPRFRAFGPLAGHLRFVERESRKLARTIFHQMLRHGAALEQKQAVLARVVDVGVELFAITAAVSRAADADTADAMELADSFCRGARARVAASFRAIASNDDRANAHLGRDVMDGRYAWLEQGIIGLGVSAERLKPRAARGAVS